MIAVVSFLLSFGVVFLIFRELSVRALVRELEALLAAQSRLIEVQNRLIDAKNNHVARL